MGFTPHLNEFLNADLNDLRLTKRFNQVVGELEGNLPGSIPQAAGSKGASKGAYRFFHNPKVSPEKLVEAHVGNFGFAACTSSMPRYLCLSDSSELDYTGKRAAKNLGPLTEAKRRGLIVHNSMVIGENGAVVGLFKQDYIIRSDEEFCKWKQRKNLPIEDKESIKWLNHFNRAQDFCAARQVEMVFVGDREADIMDIFHARRCERVHYLIRSQHNRCLAGTKVKLYEKLAQQPLAGRYTLTVTDPQSLHVRQAGISVRFCQVKVGLATRSKCKKHLAPVELTAIEAWEEAPPANVAKPIRWVLLSSLPVGGFEDALQLIGYYILRWLIERFHYLIKSGGAHVEELQLEQSHQLKNAIATYSIAVMNAMKIRSLAEAQPDTCVHDAGVSPLECEVLYTYVNKKTGLKVKYDPDSPPTAWEFCRVLGALGGFSPSKRQPLPGLKVLTRALATYSIVMDSYFAFMSMNEKDVGYQ